MGIEESPAPVPAPQPSFHSHFPQIPAWTQIQSLQRAPSSLHRGCSGAAWLKEGIQSPAAQQICIFIESLRSQLRLISVSHRNPPLSQPEQPGKSHGCIKESTASLNPPATNLPPAHPKPILQSSTKQGLGGNGRKTPRRNLEKATQLE